MEECCISCCTVHTCIKSLPSALSSDRPRAWRVQEPSFSRPTHEYIHTTHTHTHPHPRTHSLSFSHVAILDLRCAPVSRLLPFPIPTSSSIYCVISSHYNAHSLYLRVLPPRLKDWLGHTSDQAYAILISLSSASSSLVPRIALPRVQEREIHLACPPPGPPPDCLIVLSLDKIPHWYPPPASAGISKLNSPDKTQPPALSRGSCWPLFTCRGVFCIPAARLRPTRPRPR